MNGRPEDFHIDVLTRIDLRCIARFDWSANLDFMQFGDLADFRCALGRGGCTNWPAPT